ncbi:hypothetical protein ABZW18_22005 [Streptomyces sp. NPDC004647]|uniref:hypothetical protein n=1 Tax=Streptomyces sp. NPDC004647 TaxID=3154671 RepID=UPI0033BA08F0
MGEDMKRMNNRTLVRRGAALVAAAAAVTPVSAAGAQATDSRAASTVQTKQIASSVLGRDQKITLTALRSENDQYAASVRMQVYAYSGGAWKETDRVTVGEVEGWFWFPLTGSGAVCEFSTASTDPAPISVSLLITPSIGCSAAEQYRLEDGRIYAD